VFQLVFHKINSGNPDDIAESVCRPLQTEDYPERLHIQVFSTFVDIAQLSPPPPPSISTTVTVTDPTIQLCSYVVGDTCGLYLNYPKSACLCGESAEGEAGVGRA
jgi:hypothetical protein